jgi:hypothetical protein
MLLTPQIRPWHALLQALWKTSDERRKRQELSPGEDFILALLLLWGARELDAEVAAAELETFKKETHESQQLQRVK